MSMSARGLQRNQWGRAMLIIFGLKNRGTHPQAKTRRIDYQESEPKIPKIENSRLEYQNTYLKFDIPRPKLPKY